MHWLLRTLGISISREGFWYNDARGSTHLWPWPWKRRAIRMRAEAAARYALLREEGPRCAWCGAECEDPEFHGDEALCNSCESDRSRDADEQFRYDDSRVS